MGIKDVHIGGHAPPEAVSEKRPAAAARSHKAYLGDGAYVDFDGWAIVLTTEDGVRETNRVVLEPDVWRALEAWVSRLRASSARGDL